MQLMTETERKCLQTLLDKAIRCGELIVHIPPSSCGCARLGNVTSWSINGPAIQLDLED